MVLPHKHNIPNKMDSGSSEEEYDLIKDMFDLIAVKGPMSIYRIAKELQVMEKYKDIKWNALRMRITRLIYRLILAGMLEYKRGSRNSMQIDLSYNYLRGKYGKVPEEILAKRKKDIIELIRRKHEKTKQSLAKILGVTIESTDKSDEDLYNEWINMWPRELLDDVMRDIIEKVDPDLFKGWKELADRVKQYYYNALIKRELIKNPNLSIAYILYNLDTIAKDYAKDLEEGIEEDLLDLYEKYCTDECDQYYENDLYPEILEAFINKTKDFVIGKDNTSLLIGRVVVPQILRKLHVGTTIAHAKTLYIMSGKVVEPQDIKEIFIKILPLSDNKKYLRALYETIKVLLPHINRLARLAEVEANVYKGLMLALEELKAKTESELEKYQG